MYYFIVNQTGGSGSVKKGWKKINSILARRKIIYKAYGTTQRGSAAKIAQKICTLDDEDKRIVVVGGDGTLNEVLNGITDFSEVAVGIVPLGSGNDFAHGLGVPTDAAKALEAILDCEYDRKIDLGQLTYASGKSKLFGISAGIGMDALVCHKAEKSPLKPYLNKMGLGRLIYIFTTITTIMSMKRIPVSVSIDGRKPLIIEKCVFLAAMNMSAEGGGVKMAPKAACDDRRLSMCLAHNVSRVFALPVLFDLVRAKHEKRRQFFITDFKEIEIHTLSPMILHTDGEYGGEVQEIHIKVLPAKLRFLG